MKIRHKRDHGLARRAAYPPVSDQLDAIMKALHALRQQGVTLPDETAAWIDQCQAVKKRYPK